MLTFAYYRVGRKHTGDIMKTLVVYASEFGNTQKIAEAIGAGLDGAEVRYADDVQPDDLKGVGLLVVGGPTQKMHFTEPMTNFLARIPDNALKGVKVAAFDTRISIEDVQSRAERFAARLFLHRYAAKPIAKNLKEKGGTEVIEPEGFFVLDTEGPLREGELARATAWAKQVAAQVRV